MLSNDSVLTYEEYKIKNGNWSSQWTASKITKHGLCAFRALPSFVCDYENQEPKLRPYFGDPDQDKVDLRTSFLMMFSSESASRD